MEARHLPVQLLVLKHSLPLIVRDLCAFFSPVVRSRTTGHKRMTGFSATRVRARSRSTEVDPGKSLPFLTGFGMEQELNFFVGNRIRPNEVVTSHNKFFKNKYVIGVAVYKITYTRSQNCGAGIKALEAGAE